MPVPSSTYESRGKSIGADVESLATSVFDPPDNRSHKADPTLIAGDEQHFAAGAESLQ